MIRVAIVEDDAEVQGYCRSMSGGIPGSTGQNLM